MSFPLPACRTCRTCPPRIGEFVPTITSENVGARFRIAIGARDGNSAAGSDTLLTGAFAGNTPYSANLEQSLSIELYRYDSTLGDFVAVPIETWPVRVDTATGKIIVQADRSIAPLSSLSAASLIYMQTFRLYWPYPTQPDNPYATDVLSGISLGGTFVDAVGDVLNCSLGCSTGASWYPMIDLVGGSVHLQDRIFRNAFE
ncbi:MAG: hypothetical protein E6R11_00920 [Rhodocyclaceae bacterium]|nr:MAG: hypothetical protein EYC71_03915 [Gammaproteobacteria bacterium]TXG80611.1 MAG: hypothetical protein E6R11_00920 [Rhodocyclaceae bacterium]